VSKLSTVRISSYVGATYVEVRVGGRLVFACSDVSARVAEEEAVGWESLHVQRQWGFA
jgi:hypothetical protein